MIQAADLAISHGRHYLGRPHGFFSSYYGINCVA